MTVAEILGLILGGVGSLGVPFMLARTARMREMEINVAKLQAEAAASVPTLHSDMRAMREDIKTMSASMARLEGALTGRLQTDSK